MDELGFRDESRPSFWAWLPPLGGGGGSGASTLQSQSWEPPVLQFYDPPP